MQFHIDYLFVNLGALELSILFLLVLLLFGPGKLPGVMKSLGDGIRQFKNAASGVSEAAKVSEQSDKAEKTE